VVEVVRTNFAPIFSGFFGHSGTNRSALWRKFSKLFNRLENAFLPQKNNANII